MTFITRLILASYLSTLLLLWSVISISCHVCTLFWDIIHEGGAWFWNFLFIIQEQEGFQISSMRAGFWSLVGSKWLEGHRLWVVTHVLSANQVSEMIASVVCEEIKPIRDKEWYLELWVKWRYHLQHAHGCCAPASVSLCCHLRWQAKAKSTHKHTWMVLPARPS
jgi:hypothetical protein